MPRQIELTLVNRAEEVARLQDELEQFGSRQGLAGSSLHQIQLALEEHLANIFRYAYHDKAEHKVTVRIRIDEHLLEIEVADGGRPFNPLEFPEPDLTIPLEHRPIGGLGIHMIRKSVDQLAYRRERDQNILTMSKRI
jgi:anti-sigma regulatory factor (Ser/Thr protein kinase)